MEEKEPDSRYLVLWLCVFLTVGIVFVGWFVALRHNFNKINDEMSGNVTQTFEEAQQEVMDSFGKVEALLLEKESLLNAAAKEASIENSAAVNPAAVEADVVIPKTEETQ